MLIVCTLCVYRQLDYLLNKDLGYQKEDIISAYLDDKESRTRYPELKQELLKNPGISDVTISSYLPNNIGNQTLLDWDEKTVEEAPINLVIVDENFTDFFGIGVKNGTSFPEDAGPGSRYYLLNQSAVETYGLKNVAGKRIVVNGNEGEVSGVIKDIHFHSLDLKIIPLAVMNMQEEDYKGRARYLSVKIDPAHLESTLSYIKNTYAQFSPDYPLSFNSFDDVVGQAYASETRFKSLVQFFSIVAICISCLGLLGLAHHNLEKRIKEIGIRKVNGAKVSEVLLLLNKDFVKWVGVAFLLASPIAWYAMNKWLESFAYKTTLSWWIFALAGVLALGIALLTVSWQSWKAATRNPVESLRYE